MSATMFLRRDLVDRVGAFDADLGLGATTPYQSGEETDYLLRALRAGYLIRHASDLRVFHPLPPSTRDAASVRRAWSYGLGMGRVLRLHRFDLLAVTGHLLRPCLGALHAFASGDRPLARVRIARAIGRYHGWRGSHDARLPPRLVQSRARGVGRPA